MATTKAAASAKSEAEKLEKATARASKVLLDVLAKLLKEEQHKVIKGLIESVKVARKDAVVTITGEIGEEDAKKLLPQPEKK